MSSKQIFGYVILHNETKERFQTNRSTYDSKAAAVQGFNRITVKGWWCPNGYEHLKDVAFKDQTEYGVYPVVAQYE